MTTYGGTVTLTATVEDPKGIQFYVYFNSTITAQILDPLPSKPTDPYADVDQFATLWTSHAVPTGQATSTAGEYTDSTGYYTGAPAPHMYSFPVYANPAETVPRIQGADNIPPYVDWVGQVNLTYTDSYDPTSGLINGTVEVDVWAGWDDHNFDGKNYWGLIASFHGSYVLYPGNTPPAPQLTNSSWNTSTAPNGGNFATAANWTPTPPGQFGLVKIGPDSPSFSGHGSTVTSSANVEVNFVSLNYTDWTLTISGGAFKSDAGISNYGILTIASGATLISGGPTTNALSSGSTTNSATIQVIAGGIAKLQGPVSGNGKFTISGGVLELDGANSNAISFGNGGGELALLGPGAYSVSSAFNGGNYVLLDSANAAAVYAGGTYMFHDQGSGNKYVGNTGNFNVAQNAGTGHDQFYFVGTGNQLYGGSAGDWLGVNGNNNALVGGAGNNWIGASGNFNTLVAGNGQATTLFAAGTGNVLYAGSGSDWLGVSGNNNALVGGAGNDSMGASGNFNTLAGGSGSSRLYATGTGNVLYAQSGNNWLGVSGNQSQLFGGSGVDWMGASGNNSAIAGGSGASTLFANGSGNTLFGGSGNDFIGVSGSGNNLYGGGGNCYVAASGSFNRLDPYGGGSDTLVGAAAAHDHDTFVYHPGYGNVTIYNFTPQAGDQIAIAGFGFTHVTQFAPYVGTSADGSIMLNLGGSSHLTLEGIAGGLQDSWFNFHA